MTTRENITRFVARVESEVNGYLTKEYTNHDPRKTFTVSFGKKYAKIIVRDIGSDYPSVWGFVDLANGNLLKAAGWNRPAKHARGNIATAEYGRNYQWTGPNYL